MKNISNENIAWCVQHDNLWLLTRNPDAIHFFHLPVSINVTESIRYQKMQKMYFCCITYSMHNYVYKTNIYGLYNECKYFYNKIFFYIMVIGLYEIIGNNIDFYDFLYWERQTLAKSTMNTYFKIVVMTHWVQSDNTFFAILQRSIYSFKQQGFHPPIDYLVIF